MIRQARISDVNWMAHKSIKPFNKIYYEPYSLKQIKYILRLSIDTTICFCDCSAFLSFGVEKNDIGENLIILKSWFSEKAGNGIKLFKKIESLYPNYNMATVFHTTENKLKKFLKRNKFNVCEIDNGYSYAERRLA